MLANLLRSQVALWIPPAWREPLRIARPGVFRRKIAVDFTARDYRVKTVETDAELKQVLALRRSVFHYEFAGKWISLKSDKDSFDEQADHLAIIDQRSGKVVGVYRLIADQATRHYYSATEFDINPLLDRPGNMLELSRACIHKDYRNGVIITLLWRGIAEYSKQADTDFLFGLSSVSTTDPAAIAAVCRYFRGKGLIDDTLALAPRPKYAIQDFDALMRRPPAMDAEQEAQETAKLVPSLVKTYIKAGAKVCWQPVIDRDFNCTDWLTILDMRKLTSAYDRKYMQES